MTTDVRNERVERDELGGDTKAIAQRSASEMALRLLYDSHRNVERHRIQIGNRIAAIERGSDTVAEDVMDIYRGVFASANEAEERIEEGMVAIVSRHPVYQQWLRHVKGIGPGLACQLISLLRPPLPDRGPSTWFKSAGLNPHPWEGQMRLPRIRKDVSGHRTRTPDTVLWTLPEGQALLVLAGDRAELAIEAGSVFDGRWPVLGVYEWRRPSLDDVRGAGIDGLELVVTPADEPSTPDPDYPDAWKLRARLVIRNTGNRDAEITGLVVRGSVEISTEGLTGRPSYYPALRRNLHNVGTSFVRSGGYYREHYDRFKALQLARHQGDPDWPLIRIDATARWQTIKLFLCHLYEMWAEIEGIENTRRAYAIERLGHHFIPAPRPEDYAGKI